jgi:hypothetical protein
MLADDVPKVVRLPDRQQTHDEIEAQKGKLPYAPSYLDFEALEEAGDPPPREWALEHWLGIGHVTLLAARGGMGKSIFSQQLATALCLKRDFVSTVTQPRRVLVWMGEDDDDELWRRQKAICAKFASPMSLLQDRLMLESMHDTDCCLMQSIQGLGLSRTYMLEVLREQIGDLKADVVILDNSAKLYQGSENDRAQVTAFITALNWAAAPTKAAVLLISHAAKPKDSEYAGSTAWENAVRSRWFLGDHLPDKEPNNDAEESPTPDLRYLCKRKVNYTSLDVAVLRYTDGAYDIVTSPAKSGMVAGIDRSRCRGVVLAAFAKLTAMNLQTSDVPSSGIHYLPAAIIKYGFAEGFPKGDLGQAMRDLMVDTILRREVVGQYANRMPKYGLRMATAQT